MFAKIRKRVNKLRRKEVKLELHVAHPPSLPRPMERWRNRVAVVTSVSAEGIGASIVRALLDAGLTVVGLASRLEDVQALSVTLPAAQQMNLHSLQCMVGDVASVTLAFDLIEARLGGVDILVNNAGLLSQRQLLTHDIAALHEALQQNVMGVVHCTQRAFRSMKLRNFAGHVVIINSCLGHNTLSPLTGSNMANAGGAGAGLPFVNIYAPSRFAITAITEVLRQEFRGFHTQIKITSITPGMTRSGQNCMPILKPEDIAGGVLHALSRPAHEQLHELSIRPTGEVF